jgi:hypothetical protein
MVMAFFHDAPWLMQVNFFRELMLHYVGPPGVPGCLAWARRDMGKACGKGLAAAPRRQEAGIKG